jgi:transposase
MRKPIFVRALDDGERLALEAGLRSPDAFVLRRCQILLASARGKRAPAIAADLGCDDDTVLKVLHAFNRAGLEVLRAKSRRPQHCHETFDEEGVERLRGLLHQSPRHFGQATDLWTLALAAQVSFEQGLTAGQVSPETIRCTLARLGVRWQRAKRWITSPDPAYGRKKGLVTA